jgi:hypothetical protein
MSPLQRDAMRRFGLMSRLLPLQGLLASMKSRLAGLNLIYVHIYIYICIHTYTHIYLYFYTFMYIYRACLHR